MIIHRLIIELFVVYAGDDRYSISDDLEANSLRELAKELQALQKWKKIMTGQIPKK